MTKPVSGTTRDALWYPPIEQRLEWPMSVDKSTQSKRAQIVMAMVLARLQQNNRHISDLTPDEIRTEVDNAVADLKLAEDAISGR